MVKAVGCTHYEGGVTRGIIMVHLLLFWPGGGYETQDLFVIKLY